ncbi:MAG: UDP-N-acetylglucosamine--N-acetylmuramyl-(pentapeptide) pyrophosphoryl-undecaprenol [Frankiaceae bacterium]|nr:UDP-N-acetylglucosamine--N-acetylmuramyl-(pentapeptide) pyrophosphoryl-undecaprenol [Frankiaceae bacterium]
MNVVLAGGGTAGHVEPALALADALRGYDDSISVSALGTERGLETRLVPARGYQLDLIPAVPLPRKASVDLLRVPDRLLAAVRRTGRHLDARAADVVVGFGGYVALPAYLAARGRRVPIVVHEANAKPGLANRIGARFAARVAVTYDAKSLPRAVVTGVPIRRAIADLDRAALRDVARASFGLDADRPTLLVFGGSQGARRINDAITGAAKQLVAAGAQVLHATGMAGFDAVRAAVGDLEHYVPVAYLERMDLAYAAADLALCRAGALTCAELTAVGLPAVFVPFAAGNGEQRFNAAAVVEAGGALLVNDAELDGAWIERVVAPLIADGSRLAVMATAARRFGRPDADTALMRLVLDAAGAAP